MATVSGSKNKSALWLFFSLAEDTKFAICNSCNQKVSRGGASTKSFNTTNLVSHIVHLFIYYYVLIMSEISFHQN